jgi:hypothetical protein
MSEIIKDGTGKGYFAQVNEDQMLMTRSTSQNVISFVAQEKQKAFFVHSSFTTTGTNQRVLSLKNTSSEEELHIDFIFFPTNMNCKYVIEKVTGGTGAGTELTPVNANLNSAISPECDCFGNAEVTGITSAKHFGHVNVAANTTFTMNLDGAMILGKDDEISIKVAENGVAAGPTIFFHYG